MSELFAALGRGAQNTWNEGTHYLTNDVPDSIAEDAKDMVNHAKNTARDLPTLRDEITKKLREYLMPPSLILVVSSMAGSSYVMPFLARSFVFYSITQYTEQQD